MDTDHFRHMALALETEEQSEHPTHKVGALLWTIDGTFTTRPNNWPPLLKQHIGTDKKLGNASTTVHAEMATICASPATEGATLYVTDLPCPNCAKIIVESGIKEVYIDSHTHNTALGLKIKPYFENISIPIFKAANIAVYEMDVRTKTIDQLTTPSPQHTPTIHRPIYHTEIEKSAINTEHFMKLIADHKKETAFAACYAENTQGNIDFILAQPHRSIGLTAKDTEHIRTIQNKYRPTLQPINRLLLICARHGLKIKPDYLYISQTPTSREFVNIIGAGYTTLQIENPSKCRDEWGLKALAQLQKFEIIDTNPKSNYAQKWQKENEAAIKAYNDKIEEEGLPLKPTWLKN